MNRAPFHVRRCLVSLTAAAAVAGIPGCIGGEAKTPPKAPKKPPVKSAGDFRLDEAEIAIALPPVRPSRFYVQFADAFILWHFDQQWKKIAPPFSFLMKGKKEKVDTDLGKVIGHTISVRRGQPKPWDVIGWGKHGALYHDDDIGCQVYQDKRGKARLILLLDRIYGCSGMILSSISSHPGEIVKQDLTTVRTGTGIGLGDSRQKIERLHGKPSVVYPFRDSQVMWYLGKPEAVAGIEQLDQNNHRGHAAAYLLKQNEVVEILVQFWSDETAA